MKRIPLLAALALPLLFGAPGTAQAQGHGPGGIGGPCILATPADLAAARLAPVETQGMGPAECYLIWSRSRHRGMEISLRALHAPGRDATDFGPGMCAKALASSQNHNPGQKTRSCKELPGYGSFAVLMTTDADSRTGQAATILAILTSKHRVTIVAVGVPGGDPEADQRLGKVLAAKYR